MIKKDEIEIVILKIIFNTFHFKYKILKLTNMNYIIIYNIKCNIKYYFSYKK